MRKGFSFFVILMLMRFVETGQTPPTLQIAETNVVAALFWSGSSAPFFFLQATTNLLPPIMWTNLSFASGTGGTANVTMANSQQFFRLAQLTPIFQFAIFYNMNLEMQPGGAMNIGGPVFCNASIWAASYNLTFSDSVSAVGQISSNNISDPFMTAGSKFGSGNPTFTIPPISGAGVLNFPILGTNNDPASIEAMLQIPPSGVDPNSPTGSIYFYNQAELIITNSPSGGNIQVFYQNNNNAPALTLLPKDMTTYYSFVTSTNFYDYREAKNVKAIYLDVAKLGVWITNTAALGGNSMLNPMDNETVATTGRHINAVYIYNSVPMNSTTLPAVQVDNGKQLPLSGLGIATPDPIYVKGNFNTQTNSLSSDAGLNDTTYTHPAALYGDALTVLSSSWNDKTYTSGTSLGSRPAVSTTVNAAVFEGIVPSSGSNYSGGVENFMRLLEDWSSTTLTYNGSIVVMFPSQYATNFWGNSSYYGVPTRQWAFDLNFTQPGGLPPFTPWVLNLVSP